MSYVDQGMTKGRFYAIVGVAVLHALLGFAIVTGLAGNFVKKVSEDLKVVNVEEEPPPPEEEPPPPEPKQDTPPPVVAPPPIVRTAPVIQQPITVVREAPPPRITPDPPRQEPPKATPPPAPRVVPPQRARANLGSYFSTDDYPAAALRSEAQGTTRFRLTIGPNGRVSDCQVTGSSGNGALDSATCRILRSRARYTPARDSSGNPTSGTDNGSVTWRLPED